MANVYQRKAKLKSVVGTVIFYTLYTLLVAGAAFGIFYVLQELTAYLDNYERSLVKYEAEEVFEEYFSPCRFDKLYDMQNVELSEFEDKNDFITYMEGLYGGKEIIYKEVSAGMDGIKKYSVAADKVKFGEFILNKNSQPATPEDTWYLDSVATPYYKNESVAVRIYKTSKLYVNDIELSDSYITKDGITTDSCKRLPEGLEGIMLREYEVKDLLLAPTIKVINRFGKESNLVLDEKTNMYVEEIVYDTITDDIKKLATDAAQTYAKYVTLDASLANVANYFDKNSDTYNNIRISETRWYTYHIGYEFKDVELNEYYIFGEDIFSIRYSCNHYVYRTRNEEHVFPLDLTLYFKNINGKYYVYDMVSNY